MHKHGGFSFSRETKRIHLSKMQCIRRRQDPGLRMGEGGMGTGEGGQKSGGEREREGEEKEGDGEGRSGKEVGERDRGREGEGRERK